MALTRLPILEPDDGRPAARPAEPLLRVEGLSVCFGTPAAPLQAVDHASLTVNRGETVCLVGESGSGKTAIALSILRIEATKGARIAAGDIVFDGISLVRSSEAVLEDLRGRRIGMVFQEPMTALDPVFTIGDQIVETVRRHERVSVAAARARAKDLLAQVHVPHPDLRLGQIPQQLSGGMRQRALIAMALACDPDLLVADEPTTALDVTTQGQILALLRELQAKRGLAILLITHDLGIAAEVADRVVVMYAGRVAEEAPVRQALAHPRHPYTRGLLQSEVPSTGPRSKLVPIPGVIPRLDALPSGCRFHPRCSAADARCAVESPPEQREGASQFACWHPLDGSARVVSLSPGVERSRAAGDALVEIQHLTKVYSSGAGWLAPRTRVRAVDDVSLSIHRGETFGLVGESGCGKTTIGRLLMQLERPTSGVIRFEGAPLEAGGRAERARRRRAMQMVFQDPAGSIDSRWTVESVIAEPLVAHGVVRGSALRTRVDELLGLVGLDPLLRGRFAHELSGGQRQRVAIARSIALDPKFIVADEAVSALDLSIQAQVLNLLDELRTRLGLTCLFIGHGLHVVRYLSDRIGVMYAGRLVEVGPADEVLRRPAHHFTQALVSSAPSIDGSRREARLAVDESDGRAEHDATGCPYRSRCPAATQVCKDRTPLLESVGPGREVACHHPRP
jgi:peptide/nickel transport system ATP-binding protein